MARRSTGLDLRRVEEVGAQRAADAAPALLRRLAAARSRRARRGARAASTRISARRCRSRDKIALLRARVCASADLPALFRITPFVQPARPRRRRSPRAATRPSITTLVQVGARSTRPPDVPGRDGVDDRASPRRRRVRRRGRRCCRTSTPRAARRVSRAPGATRRWPTRALLARSRRRVGRRGHGRCSRTGSPACSRWRHRAGVRGRGVARALAVARCCRGRGSTARAHAYLQVDARQRAGARASIASSASRPRTRITTAARPGGRMRMNEPTSTALAARSSATRSPTRGDGRVATAESCTGGLVAGAITDIAGSSGWFDRGFVTYSNEAKIELLGVPPATLAQRTARCRRPTARAMAEGALARSRADLAVAVTGVAGPGGGTPGQAGRAWSASPGRVAGRADVAARPRHFPGDRRGGPARRRSLLALAGLLERVSTRAGEPQSSPFGLGHTEACIERSFYAMIARRDARLPGRPAAGRYSGEPQPCPSTTPMDDQKSKALAAALAQIEKQFGKGSIMKMGEAQIAERPAGRLDRLARPRHRARRRRAAARPRGRDLRAGVLRQDDAVPAGRGAGAEGRRHGGLHRRRERARPGLRGQARRQRRRSPDLAAGHRRAGARDRRHAGALGRRRRHRHRLGRGARAQGRDRRRDGRPAARACRRG